MPQDVSVRVSVCPVKEIANKVMDGGLGEDAGVRFMFFFFFLKYGVPVWLNLQDLSVPEKFHE